MDTRRATLREEQMAFWFVDVTTRKEDGRLVLDRSPALSEMDGVIRMAQLAELMFGEDFTPMFNLSTRQVDYLSENMYDESVCIALISLDYVPLHTNGVTMMRAEE